MKNSVLLKSRYENIYIRSKADVQELSSETSKVLEKARIDRFNEAMQDNDMLYLTKMLDNLSVLDIFKILVEKSKNKYIK